MLKKTLGILADPIGWVITGALVSINLAGPAYRVTVPACVLIAALRLKQKVEREANKTKKMWYLAIVFFVGLAILAVFSSKKNTNQAMTQEIAKKAVLKTLKTLATKIK